MGARAYASGDAVAFASSPDLHLAAHEAAHVVQQRGGVRLAGGVGREGDEYERHADAVADRVVRGESAEPLLDAMAHRGASGGPAVQRVTDADRTRIDQALNDAEDELFNATHSIFQRRTDAIRDFVTAAGEQPEEAPPSMLSIAAKAALATATSGIGGIVAGALTSGLHEVAGDAAHVLESYLEHLIESSLEHGVDAAVSELAHGGGHSLARFGRLQTTALAATSRDAAQQFRSHREAFYQAPNGAQQAETLRTAYTRGQEPAYAQQSRASFGQWSRLVQGGGGGSDGVLTLELAISGGRWRPRATSQGGVTAAGTNFIRDTPGTLGDLLQTGITLALELVLADWRPFVGDSVAHVRCERSSIEVTNAASACAGLIGYCQDRFGSEIDLAIHGAAAGANIAAATIWGRELAGMRLGRLAEVAE
jgi:hypothetical protein